MATEQKGDDDNQQVPSQPSVGLEGMIKEQYRKIKENAETYPYVWGSYIVVYGGFGLYLAYRWRKLRKTEDRIKVLQARLRTLVESQEPGSTATATNKSPPSADKTPPK